MYHGTILRNLTKGVNIEFAESHDNDGEIIFRKYRKEKLHSKTKMIAVLHICLM